MCAEDLPKSQSAGGVIVNSRGEIAVVNQDGISWSLPKGHLIGDESPLSAAIREISEETGIQKLTLIRELGSYERLAENSEGRQEMKTITIFLFTTPELDLKPHDPANPAAQWVKPHSVADVLSNPADKEFFASHYRSN